MTFKHNKVHKTHQLLKWWFFSHFQNTHMCKEKHSGQFAKYQEKTSYEFIMIQN